MQFHLYTFTFFYHIQEIIAKTNVMKPSPCFILRVLYFWVMHLSLYSILNLFWGMVQNKGPVSFFCPWIFSFPGTFVGFLFFVLFFGPLKIFGCAGFQLQHIGSSVFVVACGIFSCGRWDLVQRPGIEPRPHALGVQSLSHWTIREVPRHIC